MNALLILASAETAPAGDAPLISIEALPAITTFLVFGVAFAILAVKVWPTIAKALDDRNAKIVGEIKAAEDARAAAKAAQAEFEKSLANAREESANMIKQARADAQRIADELKAKNEQELAERVSRANADIEAARKAAVAELQAQSAALAVEVASRILRRQVNDQDNARLVQESLSELAASRH
jgi:F-type H+-transporting ATPase subunit b